MKFAAASLLFVSLSSIVFAEADFTSPKSAYRTYTDALVAGDLDHLKDASISSDKQTKLLEGLISYFPVEKKFREAIIKSFPDAAKDLPDPSAVMIKSIDGATVKTDGDSATLTTTQTVEPVKLKRVDGKWRVDLISMFNDDSVGDLMLFRSALADVMTDITADVEAGKFKSYADVKSNLETRVKMRIAMPPDIEHTPTTRPSTKPSTTP